MILDLSISNICSRPSSLSYFFEHLYIYKGKFLGHVKEVIDIALNGEMVKMVGKL